MRYQVIISLLCFFLLSSIAQARPLAQQPGWASTINLNIGYISSQSQFSSDDDNQITADLNNSGQKSNSTLLYPLLRIQYTTENLQNQFFLDNSRENLGRAQFQYELGYLRQLSQRSQILFAYFPELPLFNETWSDPYLTDIARSKSEDNYQGGRIKYKFIADSPFSVQYAYAQRTLDNEQSGVSLFGEGSAEAQILNRNANLHRLQGEMYIHLAKSFSLSPALLYTRSQAKGDANDHDDYSIRLSSLYRVEKHLFNISMQWGETHYSANNPVFEQQTQKNENLSLFALYMYQQPFAWKNTRFNVLAGYSKSDSNINFYNSKMAIVSCGFAYTF